jgi:hypothetical protein
MCSGRRPAANSARISLAVGTDITGGALSVWYQEPAPFVHLKEVTAEARRRGEVAAKALSSRLRVSAAPRWKPFSDED